MSGLANNRYLDTRLGSAALGVAAIGSAVAVGLLVSKGGVPVAGLFIAGPLALLFVIICLARPIVGFWTYIHLSFLVNGLGRLLETDAPFGLAIDGLLLLTLLGILLHPVARPNGEPSPLHVSVFYLVLGWFIYTLLQLLNPETRSREAWFYAVRGVSLYWIQVVIIVLLIMKDRRVVNQFIWTWLVWSVLAAIWAFKQQNVGLTHGETVWLEAGAKKTHVLFGHLRSFSFYSDAGQFGAAMAHVTLFALIKAFEEPKLGRKLIFAFLALFFFWGFAIAGSRGPLFVLVVGLPLYLFLKKNIFILSIGLTLAGGAFGLLKFTNAGQGNYQVQRIRSALDPNDPSLLVRLENQQKLSLYLASRPLGGGIGSGGDWGRRFSPGTFLAETALDSWYVKIWVESGVIGLVLHLLSLGIMAVIGFIKVSRLCDPALKSTMMGLYCGFVGVAAASYGNQVFGQLPSNTVLYISLVFFTVGARYEPAPEPIAPDASPESLIPRT